MLDGVLLWYSEKNIGPNEYITGSVLDGTTSIDTDTTTTLTPKVKLVNCYATRYLWSLDSFTFTSSNPQVATVSDDDVVTALRGGTTSITVSVYVPYVVMRSALYRRLTLTFPGKIICIPQQAF